MYRVLFIILFAFGHSEKNQVEMEERKCITLKIHNVPSPAAKRDPGLTKMSITFPLLHIFARS